jgi:GNAT superfamily N-acetyltransferase
VTGAAASFVPVSVALRDGRSVTIRCVQPGDADRLSAAFTRLSSDARYSRFMGSVRALSEAALERAVRPVPGRELALIAESAELIVAGARYAVEADGGSCEFAVTVADEWQRAGLASQMLRALLTSAKSAGLTSMHGYVLASNKPMLELARRLGFEVQSSDEGPTVRLVLIRLV